MTLLDDPSATGPAPAARRPATAWVLFGLAIVVLLLGLGGLGFQGKLGDVQKNDNSAFLPTSADSTKVSTASEKFSPTATVPGNVVYRRDGGLTGADRAAIARDRAAFARIKGVAADQIGPVQYSRTHPGVAAISVPLIGKQNGKSVEGPELVDAEKAVLRAARDGAPAGLQVHSAGAGGVLTAFIDAFSGLDGVLLLAAVVIVVVILLFVYRSPVLWFFPLFSAAVSLGASALVIYPLAKSGAITLNGQSQGILSVLVIGAGTDYALLLISRYREELHLYQSRVAAMVAAWKGAASAIGASALTVILGLICLELADLNSTASLGPVCAIGIAATLIVMLTVLPVLLVLAGRWIFWPRRPTLDHHAELANHGAWARFAGGVTAHPRRSWALGGLVLILCAIALSTLKIGELSTVDSFTDKPDAVVGQQLYDQAFPSALGAGAPADILVSASRADAVIDAVRKIDGVSADRNAVCVETDFAKVAQLVKRDPAAARSALGGGGCAPAVLQVTPRDGRTIVEATLADSYDSPAAYATVGRLRSTVERVDPGALVGGSSATNLDVQNASRHDRNLIIPVVLVVILIVLAVLLRALLAPLLLIVSVVLSFAAALGISALFFDHVFHYRNADPAFPLFAFVFLVALGIDYNIFLMTRVREETLKHGTRSGIVRGLALTGGVITSAGVVLAATFAALNVVPVVFLAEIGFTVAFGVLLDTILVRSVVVPAVAYDIGKRIWWPSRLARAAD